MARPRFLGEAPAESDPFEAAQASLSSYRSGTDGEWSDLVAGAGDYAAVVVQGTSDRVIVHAYVGDEWQKIDHLGRLVSRVCATTSTESKPRRRSRIDGHTALRGY